jgi:hypothetical protein
VAGASVAGASVDGAGLAVAGAQPASSTTAINVRKNLDFLMFFSLGSFVMGCHPAREWSEGH